MALTALEDQGAVARFGFGTSACYSLSRQLLSATGVEPVPVLLLEIRESIHCLVDAINSSAQIKDFTGLCWCSQILSPSLQRASTPWILMVEASC